MIKEIGLHIIEVCINSVNAKADRVEVSIEERDKIYVTVSDNGVGMDEETRRKAFDEGFTTGKSGGGIGLFRLKSQAENACLCINENKGCTLKAEFKKDFPLGDMAAVMSTLICTKPNVEFIYRHTFKNNIFEFTTENLKNLFCAKDLSHEWKNVCGYIEAGEEKIYGGASK